MIFEDEGIINRFLTIPALDLIMQVRGITLSGIAGMCDFKAEVGTPVFSSFPGRVTRTNWNTRKNGFCVEVDHPDKGVKTLYLHLDKVLVRPGRGNSR